MRSAPADDADLALDAPGTSAAVARDAAAFTLRLRVDLPAPADARETTLGELIAHDGSVVAALRLRIAGADHAQREWDATRQNYLRWAGADGRAAVLEAEVAIAIRPPFKPTLAPSARVGVPLALIGAGARDIALRARAGKLDLIVDGRLVDEEWPCGAPPTFARLRLHAPARARAWSRALDDAALGVARDDRFTLATHELQYWTPPGHNRWLGDVVLAHLAGRTHLLYLDDRRHHGSKSGCGAHQIGQLVSDDLRTWRHQPLALPIAQPWETIGTGSLVLHDGRYRLMYGLHTERLVVPEAATDGSAHGDARALPLPQPFAALGKLPLGCATASSDDGVVFRKDETLIHAAQNPTVFRDPRGDGWLMLSGEGGSPGSFGLWRSDDLARWTPVDRLIIPFGELAPNRNTLECPCHLAWNGWHYLIAGWRGFWMARDVLGPYWDRGDERGRAIAAWMAERGAAEDAARPPRPGPVATPRWDIYDGLAVPMVVKVGERVVLGGFLGHDGWAGCLVLRELTQEPDGTLALGWLPESLPPLGAAQPLASLALRGDDAAHDGALGALPDDGLVELTIEAGAREFGLRLVGDGVDGCELRFDAVARTAAWQAVAGESRTRIAGVEGLDRRFTLRLRIARDDKAGGVVLDAWIDGRRTLIARCRGLGARRLEAFAVGGRATFADIVVRQRT